VSWQKGLEISLANKTVVVMDPSGTVRKLTALGPGVPVIVCHRKDRVVIYVVSGEKGRSSHAY